MQMVTNKALWVVGCAVMLGLCGCSGQQSDWEKTRSANTTDAYEQFLKKYPAGEFAAQAQARVKELYEEHDWQKARDADTTEAYQEFLKQYPDGKWTEEARIRVENLTLAQAPGPPGSDAAGAAGRPASGAAGAAREPAAAAPSATPPASPSSAATPAAPAPTADSGSYGVQLGAFKSGAAAANKHWARLEKLYPKTLAGLTPKVSAKKTAAGTIHRLQVVGMSEQRAQRICNSLKAKSQPCVLLPPAHH
jgi:cell division septation protein DedD